MTETYLVMVWRINSNAPSIGDFKQTYTRLSDAIDYWELLCKLLNMPEEQAVKGYYAYADDENYSVELTGHKRKAE